MNIVSFICFIICLAIIASALRRDADVFSPGRVFGFVWALAIGLTELKFSGLQHTWTFESWAHLMVGVFSFLLGIFIAYVQNIGRPLLPVSTIRRSWTKDIDEKKLFTCIVVIFALYLLAYFIITFVKGVRPPLFSDKPWIARRDFTMFAIGLFLHNVVIVAFFSIVYFLIARGQTQRKLGVLAMTVVSLLTYFFLLQRLQIMMTGIVCAALVYYTTSHIRKSTVLLYLLGATLFFLLVSSLRAGQVLVLFLYKSSHMRIPPAYALFTEPYMYVVMNLENFARSVDKLETLSYGYYTFDFTTALIGLKHWIGEYFGMIEDPYLVSSYNTYTAFWTYYRDFGIPGLGIIPALLGWGIGLSYYWMRTSPNIRSLTLYSMAVFVMFMSFFNSPIGFLWFVYMVGVMAFVVRWTRRREIRSAETEMPEAQVEFN
jgi:oligosaccharide repeat unit polymerase